MTSDRPFLPWARPEFWGNEQRYVEEALASTWISGGPFVERLEREVAACCGVPHALTASNGTAAIHMSCLGLGLRPGDEVVVPGFGFLAAANVALHIGVKPVFAEVDPATWCVTASCIERCITSRTKAIVPVHTYGNVCAMDDILEMAASRGIPIVEDAAESFASRYRGRAAGAMGTIGTLSFQATKTITTGEGGMVLTTDPSLRDKMALYRSHGMIRQNRYYWHELPGHNFRLTNLQAALGCAQMERLDQIVAARKRVHFAYTKRLAGIQGVTPQVFTPDVDPVLWAMALRLDPGAYPQGRDTVIEQLKEAGMETRPGFYAPSLMPHLYSCPPLAVCEQLSREVLSLPTYPSLSDEDIERVCAALDRVRK